MDELRRVEKKLDTILEILRLQFPEAAEKHRIQAIQNSAERHRRNLLKKKGE